ncbi:hypothetical protein [Streptomyces sp. NPDC001020]
MRKESPGSPAARTSSCQPEASYGSAIRRRHEPFSSTVTVLPTP